MVAASRCSLRAKGNSSVQAGGAVPGGSSPAWGSPTSRPLVGELVQVQLGLGAAGHITEKGAHETRPHWVCWAWADRPPEASEVSGRASSVPCDRLWELPLP